MINLIKSVYISIEQITFNKHNYEMYFIKLSDLKQERYSKIQDLEGIINKVEREKREITNKEIQQFEKIELEIEELNKQINNFDNKNITTKMITKKHKFNLTKAINEFSKHNLTGLEKELHEYGIQELKNNNLSPKGLVLPSFMFSKQNFEDVVSDMSNGSGHISQKVIDTDFVTPKSLLQELGVKELHNLSTKVSIPFSKGHKAERLLEGQQAQQGAAEQTYGTLEPVRFQGYDVYGNEFLKVNASSQFILESISRGLNNAIFSDLLDKAVKQNVITGYTTTSTAILPTWGKLIEPLKVVETDEFSKSAYVMSKAIYHLLQGSEVSNGSGRFILENGMINGIKTYGTSLLTGTDSTHLDVIYADWSKVYVGYYSPVELLIDEITKADNGQTKITYVRYAETSINPYAVSSMRNIKLS